MKKILIIDDTDSIRQDLVTLLKLENYSVIEAIDGLQGLEFASDQLPDLIISDVMMPNMDGFDMLEKIRERPETKNIPLIFLSTMPKCKAINRLTSELGAQEYLQKPYKSVELLALLNLLVKGRN